LANCTTPFTIYRNGTSIGNNSVVNSGVSSYNFSFLRTDTQNYSYIYNESEFRVNQVTPTLTKYLNQADSNFNGIYPIGVNASGHTNFGTLVMTRNSTNIISQNNVNTSLAAGYYDFTFSVTGNTNISNVADQHLYATINRNETICGVYFNATSPITYPATFIVYTNCTSVYTLYRNGTTINNATTINAGAGYYNLTVQRTDTANYTYITTVNSLQ